MYLPLAFCDEHRHLRRMDINWIGIATLYKREVWRFMKVWNQTLTAPMVTTVLFFIILTVALGRGDAMMGDLPFALFIVPGLMMMTIVQNAFANTSSSLMLQKIQGVIVDLLMPPLSAGEIMLAMTLGGVTRGLLVGCTVAIAMYFCQPYQMHHVGLALLYVLLASSMMALLGLLSGIWAQSFDQMAAISNYLVTPLSFLSGTFYSITRLPELWQQISHLNPFYYMIDGFRYAITGYSDSSVLLGLSVLMGVNIALALVTHAVLSSGYRLKS